MNKKGIIVAAALVVALASVGTVSAFAASAGGTTAWNASPSFDNCETLSYSEGAANCHKLSGDIVSASAGKATVVDKECVIVDNGSVSLTNANNGEEAKGNGTTTQTNTFDNATPASAGKATVIDKECVIVSDGSISLKNASTGEEAKGDGTTTQTNTSDSAAPASAGKATATDRECVIVNNGSISLTNASTGEDVANNGGSAVTGKAPN